SHRSARRSFTRRGGAAALGSRAARGGSERRARRRSPERPVRRWIGGCRRGRGCRERSRRGRARWCWRQRGQRSGPVKRALTRVLWAVALCLSAGRGLAQNTDVVLAETLYNEGRRLVEEGKFQEACPKFAESYRIDPATGTLLNLAACQEALGRYASAWTQYQEAVIAARRDQRPDRVSYAQERLAAIEPKLSWLTIQVPVAARVEGLALTLDGVRIGEAAFGVATPIDAGVHHVEASAPGYRAWTEELSITKEGERYTLNVPALEPAPEEPAPPPPTDV